MVKNGTAIESLFTLDQLNDLGIESSYTPQTLDGPFRPQNVNPSLQQQLMKENEERDVTTSQIMKSRIRQSSNMRKAMNAGIDPRVYEMGMDVNQMENDVYELGPKAMRNITQNSNLPQPPPHYRQHNTVPSNSPHFPYVIEGYDTPPKINCLDVANHIQNCPICSKFYENDKSIYIVVIVILIILCIILVKKLIDCYNKQ